LSATCWRPYRGKEGAGSWRLRRRRRRRRRQDAYAAANLCAGRDGGGPGPGPPPRRPPWPSSRDLPDGEEDPERAPSSSVLSRCLREEGSGKLSPMATTLRTNFWLSQLCSARTILSDEPHHHRAVQAHRVSSPQHPSRTPQTCHQRSGRCHARSVGTGRDRSGRERVRSGAERSGLNRVGSGGVGGRLRKCW
jgi:hypothetical protein